MDKKILLFCLIILFVSGSVFGCSGWITNENGTYYNTYYENGTLNQTIYMDGSNDTTSNTNGVEDIVYLGDYKTT